MNRWGRESLRLCRREPGLPKRSTRANRARCSVCGGRLRHAGSDHSLLGLPAMDRSAIKQ